MTVNRLKMDGVWYSSRGWAMLSILTTRGVLRAKIEIITSSIINYYNALTTLDPWSPFGLWGSS